MGSTIGLLLHWSREQSPLNDLISHPHKQETRGLDTIQATSFFPWWRLLFFVKKKKSFLRNHRPVIYFVSQNKYYLGTYLTTKFPNKNKIFWMNKEKLTRAGFEPATCSGLTCRRSTNWANYIGGLPILSISLFGGGGAPVRSHETKTSLRLSCGLWGCHASTLIEQIFHAKVEKLIKYINKHQNIIRDVYFVGILIIF